MARGLAPMIDALMLRIASIEKRFALEFSIPNVDLNTRRGPNNVVCFHVGDVPLRDCKLRDRIAALKDLSRFTESYDEMIRQLEKDVIEATKAVDSLMPD